MSVAVSNSPPELIAQPPVTSWCHFPASFAVSVEKSTAGWFGSPLRWFVKRPPVSSRGPVNDEEVPGGSADAPIPCGSARRTHGVR